jgi:hypothetical protein
MTPCSISFVERETGADPLQLAVLLLQLIQRFISDGIGPPNQT